MQRGENATCEMNNSIVCVNTEAIRPVGGDNTAGLWAKLLGSRTLHPGHGSTEWVLVMLTGRMKNRRRPFGTDRSLKIWFLSYLS